MKRILAILLCLMLLLCGMTACKPDTITDPAIVTDPDLEETPFPGIIPEADPNKEKQPEASEDSAEAPEEKPEEQPEEKPEEQPEEKPEETPEAEEKPEAEDAEAATTPEKPLHPFAAEGFAPSKEMASALSLSGLTKNTDAAATLKDRTISLFTAKDSAAFNYVNQKGRPITEWDWMKELAAAQGFTLKLSVKSAETSLKSQRVALLAGKKLSLLQLRGEDLAAGLTLAKSAAGKIDKSASSYGVSKAVLEQSNYILFAPKGHLQSLWYNKALTPEGMDPNALAKENKWTLSAFKSVYENAVAKSVEPLQMSDELAWATLSGKSPLTLLKGKLDSNIHARVTRAAWKEIRTLRAGLPAFTPIEGTAYNIKFGNSAMIFTDTPERGEKVNMSYAPLPSLKEGTAGTVVFSGTFMALPKYSAGAEADAAALTFAELWCNRFTEARFAALAELGMTVEDYVNYVDFAEINGHLILHNQEIETLAASYLAGLNDAKLDMEAAYDKIEDRLMALIDRYNLYY